MKIEIYHDILAKKVLEKVSGEKKMLRKVERLVHERYAMYSNNRKAKKLFLSQNDLDIILPYRTHLKITPEERIFVDKSRDEQRRSVQRRRAEIGVVVVILILLVYAIVQTFTAINQRTKAERSAIEANAQRTEAQQNADEASNQKVKAEQNAENAKTQKAKAERNAIEANEQRNRAEILRRQALHARDTAKLARAQLASNNKAFMEGLLSEARKNIRTLAYKQAVSNLNIASTFGSGIEVELDWKKKALESYFEIIFYYLKAGNEDKAVALLEQFEKVRGQKSVLSDLYEVKNKQDSTISAFLGAFTRLTNRINKGQALQKRIVDTKQVANWLLEPNWKTREEKILQNQQFIAPLVPNRTIQEIASIDPTNPDENARKVENFKISISIEKAIKEALSDSIAAYSSGMILQELQRIDKRFLEELQRKYFPSMIKVEIPGSTPLEIADAVTTIWQYGLYCAATNRDIVSVTSNRHLQGEAPILNVSAIDIAKYANWLGIQKGLDTAYIIDNQNRTLRNDFSKAYRLPSIGELSWTDSYIWERSWVPTLGRDTLLYSLNNLDSLQFLVNYEETGFRLVKGDDRQKEITKEAETNRLVFKDDITPVLLPLYFDDDVPRRNPRTPYRELVNDYLNRKTQYLGSGCNDDNAAVITYFDEVQDNINRLDKLADQLIGTLKDGAEVILLVTLEGSSSGSNRITKRLSDIRMNSVLNAIKDYAAKSGNEIEESQLTANVVQSGINTSFENYPRRGLCSKFDIRAARQRRVEILGWIEK